MSKVKLNSGLAAIILLASLFSGWQTLLIVTALMFIFCDIDDKVKNVAIKVITFYVGLYLVSLCWDLINDGVDFIISAVGNLVSTINCYLDYDKLIDISKLNTYLFNPISYIMKILDGAVSWLIIFAKVTFIICVLSNKQMKENVIVKKINEFVTKAVNYVQSFNIQ